MSLINDALIDLESRGVSPLKNTNADRSEAKQHKTGIGNRYRFILGGSLIFAGIITTMNLAGRGAEEEDISLQIAESENSFISEAVLANKEPAPAKSVLAEPVSTGAVFAEPVFTERVTAVPKKILVKNFIELDDREKELNEKELNRQNKISSLLESAKYAYEKNRLTLSRESSAFALYSQVSALDPKNLQAKLGIKELESRYQEILMGHLKSENLDKAKLMLARANELGLKINGLPLIKEMVNKVEIRRVQYGPVVQKAIVTEPTIKINKSRKYQVEQQLIQVDDLLINRQYAMAEAQLNMLLDADINNEQARIRLFDLYMLQSHFMGARKLSDRTGGSETLNIYMKARIVQLDQGDWAAVEHLESHDPEIGFAEKYLAFYAALLQKNKKWEAAETVYQKLVRLNSGVSNYWLGLAVCLDSLKDELGALQAFQQVKIIGVSNKSVAKYSDSRINALTAQLKKQRNASSGEAGLADALEW